MVELFVTDIDGCLSVPFEPFRLDQIAVLRDLIATSQQEDSVGFPKFSICSGRSYAYVEAMTQLLGIREPVLFESAGGMIFPESMMFDWNPDFTPELDQRLTDVRSVCVEHIAGTELWIDLGKRTQAGLAGPAGSIAELIDPVRRFVESQYADMLFTHTLVSIDIVPTVLAKKEGMRWLAACSGVPLENMAYIGDANGDIGALELVGQSYAPANAAADVKECVQFVTDGFDIDGVIEAYRNVVKQNLEE